MLGMLRQVAQLADSGSPLERTLGFG